MTWLLIFVFLFTGCEPEQVAPNGNSLSSLQILIEGVCAGSYELWQTNDRIKRDVFDCELAKYVYEELASGIYEIRIYPASQIMERWVTFTKKPYFQTLHITF